MEGSDEWVRDPNKQKQSLRLGKLPRLGKVRVDKWVTGFLHHRPILWMQPPFLLPSQAQSLLQQDRTNILSHRVHLCVFYLFYVIQVLLDFLERNSVLGDKEQEEVAKVRGQGSGHCLWGRRDLSGHCWILGGWKFASVSSFCFFLLEFPVWEVDGKRSWGTSWPLQINLSFVVG